jgi:hypothetical protein
MLSPFAHQEVPGIVLNVQPARLTMAFGGFTAEPAKASKTL